MNDDDAGSNGRLRTGIAGLDVVLSGGVLRGSTTIVQGAPGSGKTVFANQVCFNQARSGEIAVYITLLAESHTRLLRHLATLAFFDPAAVGERILYLSGYHALREGVTALLALVQQELVARRPGLLVLDGIASIQELHGVAACRQFLHELQVSTEAAACTALLTSANATSPSPEDAVVDAAISLAENRVGVRPVRELHVHKTRGSAHLPGRHTFVIDERGLTVFPRIESLYRTPSLPLEEKPSRVCFDVPAIDGLLGGGLRAGSNTLILGATGTGKTLLGLSFLAAGLRRKHGAVYSGFYEAPARLIAAGDRIGLGLGEAVEAGRLRIDWRAPIELFIDAWAARLLQVAREMRPQRLFIDGLNAIQEDAVYPERLTPFLTALSNELRGLGVTTLIAGEMHPIMGPTIDVPLPGVSPLVENTILLRFVEDRSRLKRLISVLKVRDSAHETTIREFSITSTGIRVGPVARAGGSPEQAPRRRRR